MHIIFTGERFVFYQNVVDVCWGENLFAGSHPASFGESGQENLQQLAKQGIDIIYSFEKNYSQNITSFWQRLANKKHKLKVGMTKMTVPDFDGPDINQLTTFVETVSKELEHQKVFIHCRGGLGRTGTFLAALYMYKTDCDVEEAINKVREIYQPYAIESKEQVESLHLFRASLNDMFFGLAF